MKDHATKPEKNAHPEYLTRTEASDYLHSKGYPVAKGTLQKLASVGGGPIYHRFGHRALYKAESLIAWAQSRLSKPISSTSEL